MKRNPLFWCFLVVITSTLLFSSVYSGACAIIKGSYSVRLLPAEQRGFYFRYGCLCRTFDKNNQPVDISWNRGLGIVEVSWAPT
jgi:hypothetical protein